MENKLQWSALEYEEKDRGNDWFWALGIIIVAGSITAFIYGNIFFGILLIVGGILMIVFAIKKPDVVNYELNEKGLLIRSRMYLYEQIRSYWIEKETETPSLFIRTDRAFAPMISMPINLENTEEIKSFMDKAEVPEEEMKEHISEKIMTSLGF